MLRVGVEASVLGSHTVLYCIVLYCIVSTNNVGEESAVDGGRRSKRRRSTRHHTTNNGVSKANTSDRKFYPAAAQIKLATSIGCDVRWFLMRSTNKMVATEQYIRNPRRSTFVRPVEQLQDHREKFVLALRCEKALFPVGSINQPSGKWRLYRRA